jgi:hypothetical protein
LSIGVRSTLGRPPIPAVEKIRARTAIIFFRKTEIMDGRDKPGHDDVEMR